MPFSTVRGVRLYYEQHGSLGSWLTLIHGGLVHSGSWQRQVSELASGCRVLTYDVRGYGRSERPPGGYTIPDFAQDLRALWDDLGIEQGFVLGFSMGGFVAQLAALQWPERVAGLILVSTAAGLDERAREAFRERAAVAEHSGLEQERSVHVQRAFSPRFRDSTPDFIAAYANEIVQNDRHAFAQTFRGLAGFESRERLGEIRCATLILAGELDEAIPPPAARELNERIPGSKLVLLPGIGHTIHIEDPATFNRLVSEFVTSHSESTEGAG